jgi:hypothetical protein
MLAAGLPVGGGTDATRVSSYNPWVSLAWLVGGRTVGGMALYPMENLLDREAALRLWTESNAWFSDESGKKGRIAAGQLADLAVLSADYMAVPEREIAGITSVLTLVGGRVVHGDRDFRPMAPVLPPAMPDWSPVRRFGGYQHTSAASISPCACDQGCGVHGHDHAAALHPREDVADLRGFWGAMGCSCWAF